MHTVVHTNMGHIMFNGCIDRNARIIFTRGYCANFAKILHQRTGMLLCYITIDSSYIDHWFCYNTHNDLYYDINGPKSKDEFEQFYEYRSNVEYTIDCSIEEYYSIDMGEDKDDYLAECIIEEYMYNHNIKKIC